MRARKKGSNKPYETIEKVQLMNSDVLLSADSLEFDVSSEVLEYTPSDDDKHWQFASIDGYEEIYSALAIAFMDYLDKHRPNGKMCLSNGQCADIDRAFQERDFERLSRYLHKFREQPIKI